MADSRLNGDEGGYAARARSLGAFSGWLSDAELPGFPEYNERNDDMKLRVISLISAASFLLIWLLALPAWAAEYRLEVTDLDYMTYSAYQEHLGNLEKRLDRQKLSTAAVIPGREVQVLEDPGYGGKPPAQLSVLPATNHQAWTTLVWDGNPGDTVAFEVKSDVAAWQEVWRIAADTGEGLKQLALGDQASFDHQRPQVPEVANDFLANAVNRGTFPQWLAQHAQPIDGLSLVVGQGDNPNYRPDSVYAVVKLPPEPRTYKLVIGWADRSNRGDKGRGGITTRCIDAGM
jgi:hypothetical protein